MSQTCECGCGESTIIPLRGLALDISGLPGMGTGDGISYSFEEQWTGKRWIDGKKVYQKTINFGAMPNNTTKKVFANIPSIDFMIDLAGSTWGDDSGFTLPRATHASANAANCIFSKGDILISTGISWPGYEKTYVTIWYTCADR